MKPISAIFLLLAAPWAMAGEPGKEKLTPTCIRHYIHAVGKDTLLVHSCLTPTRFTVQRNDETVVIWLDGKPGTVCDLKVGQWVKLQTKGKRNDPRHQPIAVIEVVKEAAKSANEKKAGP